VARLEARLELRVDKRTYQRLERRAAAERVSVAEIVRNAIDRELSGDERSWRVQAVERAGTMCAPVPDDPAELARELDAATEVPRGG
jgi:hypothetical protein